MFCCVVCLVCCSDSENDSQQQTQKEAKTENNMTRAEKRYFKKAKKEIEQISKYMEKIDKIIKDASGINGWKKATQYAEECIQLGEKLQNLQSSQENEAIAELVQRLGNTVAVGAQEFLDGLENSSSEKLEHWLRVDRKNIAACTNEINAYMQEGITIQQQLAEQFQEIEITFLPGTPSITMQLEEKEKNAAFQKIYDVLYSMSKEQKYDYFDISFHFIEQNSDITIKSSTRQQLDFTALHWQDIEQIANKE